MRASDSPRRGPYPFEELDRHVELGKIHPVWLKPVEEVGRASLRAPWGRLRVLALGEDALQKQFHVERIKVIDPLSSPDELHR